MSKKLAGKVAVVTGASKGIGASIALELGSEGASVVVNYSSDKAGAEKVVKEIVSKGGKAIAVKANVAEQKEIKTLFEETKKAFGKLDILVNNAGIYEFVALADVTPENFHRQFNINVLGLILATQEAVKLFGSSGSIINISSIASYLTPVNTSVYSATKASVDAITKVLSKELGPRKIRVNALNPGVVDTEGTRSAGIMESDFRKDVEARTPIGRIGVPRDVGLAAVFLASEDSSWISGETLSLSGGYTG